MKKIFLNPLVGVVLLLTTFNFNAFSQTNHAESSLRDQWSQMIKASETYNDYKIVKDTKLQGFSEALRDSLSQYSESLENLKSEKSTLEAELSSLQADLTLLQEKLTESEKVKSEISLLGISMKKRGYSAVMWSMIGFLMLVAFVLYARIKRVCQVVHRVKSAYSKISDEYRSHRHQSIEHQIKLKRELQTALNKLEMAS